ncbi:MAG TPA: D-alanine--D-alanine ligase family protein [Jatrophihabitans sp.]|jgi:D-alanine-D-alanine ligase
MTKIRVAVVYGGRSSEHGISVVSAGSVIAALDPERYEVVPVGIKRDGAWVLTAGDAESMRITGRSVPAVVDGTAVVLPADPTAKGLVAVEPDSGVQALESVDVVFPVLHGRFGEDGTIQGLLEMAGVPYVGPGVFASAAAMDKEYTKKLLAAEGLAVGTWSVLRRRDPVDVSALEPLGLPAFVKPARAGSSVGITKITDWAQLPDALATAFEHDNKVLVEAAITGHEVECGVLEGPNGVPEASVPAEIRLTGSHDWYDFDAKYLDEGCEFDVPAKLPGHVSDALRQAACRAFVALDCAGLARVDFFVTEDEQIVVNEVNTMPGFTPISMFPRMWQASGVEYPELVDRLIASALRRHSA